MSLYAIGDLHLSFTANKPMDIFGKEWKDHVKKIEKNWNKMISSGDTVVLAGDHSWGRNLKEAEADLEFIASLPGRKDSSEGESRYVLGCRKDKKAE